MTSSDATALRDRILQDIGSSYPDWRVQADSYPDAAYDADGVDDDYFVTVVMASDTQVEIRSWEEWLENKPFGVA